MRNQIRYNFLKAITILSVLFVMSACGSTEQCTSDSDCFEGEVCETNLCYPEEGSNDNQDDQDAGNDVEETEDTDVDVENDTENDVDNNNDTGNDTNNNDDVDLTCEETGCPEDVEGDWGECEPVDQYDTCSRAGEKSREVVYYECGLDGDCVEDTKTEKEDCQLETTEGDACGIGEDVEEWGSCEFPDDVCAETGEKTRLVKTYECGNEECLLLEEMETQTCNRTTEDNSCGETEVTDWSSCEPVNDSDVCSTYGIQYRQEITYTCGSGSCESTTEDQSQSCSLQDTEGNTCDSTNYGAWSDCTFSSTCAETGTKTRTVTTYTCGSNEECESVESVETDTCNRNTEDNSCGGNDNFCEDGQCVECFEGDTETFYDGLGNADTDDVACVSGERECVNNNWVITEDPIEPSDVDCGDGTYNCIDTTTCEIEGYGDTETWHCVEGECCPYYDGQININKTNDSEPNTFDVNDLEFYCKVKDLRVDPSEGENIDLDGIDSTIKEIGSGELRLVIANGSMDGNSDNIIEGDLDLNTFSNLEKIEGDLTIRTTGDAFPTTNPNPVVGTGGLESLETIEGVLDIDDYNFDWIGNLDFEVGFPSLTTIDDGIADDVIKMDPVCKGDVSNLCGGTNNSSGDYDAICTLDPCS